MNSDDADRIMRQAVDLAIEIYAVLQQAYGTDLAGAARGKLVSSHYLARIRDLMLGHKPERPPQICAECIELRQRLVNVYHLTLTGSDPESTVRAVREVSGPGAPAPGVTLPRCGCSQSELLSKLESQGRMLEECANTLAIAGYGDLAWRGHAMRKATRAQCEGTDAPPAPAAVVIGSVLTPFGPSRVELFEDEDA